MTMAIAERTVLPPQESLDDLLDLFRGSRESDQAELVGPGGIRIHLPVEVYEVLCHAVFAMGRGQAVTIAPHHQRLTTQEAADILGVSRPTLVKILDDELIPYEQPGRHRRVMLVDVLNYQEQRRQRREAGLDALVEASEDMDGYPNTPNSIRTR